MRKTLKLIRLYNELSQKDLAKRLDMCKSYLSEIESGKKNVTLNIIRKFEKYFQIPASAIFTLSEMMAEAQEPAAGIFNIQQGHKDCVVKMHHWYLKERLEL